MRLTTVILIATIMQVSAGSFAQKLTLTQKKVSLKQLFKEIKIQTGYDVFWQTDNLKISDVLSADFKATQLDVVMTKVLEGKNLEFKIDENTIVIKEKIPTFLDRLIDRVANIDIKGRVLDEKGKGLGGATVRVRNTNKVVYTNQEGFFMFKGVNDTATLVISYIGYKTKEVIAYHTGPINVSLEVGSSDLENVNVVSTGYQTLAKERATGSFDKIDNKLFNRITGTDVISRLNGTVPGLFVNSRSAVPETGASQADFSTIRGLSSLSVTRPLIILDNLPYDGDVNNINPNDVDNITILKDAAAASLWGTRAGNGVIVITTKKGKYENAMDISFNTNFTISQKPDLFYIPKINSTDFITVEKFLFAQGFYDSNLSNSDPYPTFITPVVKILSQQPAGIITPQANAQIDALRQNDVRKDYLKYIYRRIFNQQYALNLSGGSKQSSYFISGGYDKNLNSLKTSDYDRITLRSNYNLHPLRNLEIQTGILFTQSRNNDIAGNSSLAYGTGLLSNIYPYARLATDQGVPLEPGGPYYSVDYLNTLDSNPNLLNWHYKPLEDVNQSSAKIKSEDILFNLGANYVLNSIFSVDLKYQYETINSNRTELFNPSSFFIRDLVNTYTDPSTFNRAIPTGGRYNPSFSKSNLQTFRSQIDANKTWNEKHQLIAIAGAEMRKSYTLFNDQGYLYGYDPATKSFKTVDYQSASIPLYYGGEGQIDYNAAVSDADNRLTSLFANASYSYNNRYILSASVRKDASNVFGVNSNKRGRPLFSVGTSWNLSNETFYNSTILPFLKLRATYGTSGNTIMGTPAFAVVNYNVNSLTQLPYTRALNLPNPDLRWEKVGMINFGMDFSFKNNRVSGSLEYYDKRATDLLASSPIDPTTGFTIQTYNAANLHGSGIDLQVKSDNLNLKDFKWNSTFIFSYNTTKVTRYLLKRTTTSVFLAAGAINPIAGKDAYAIFAYEWGGLDPETGDPRGYLNGQISKNYSSILNGNISDLKYFGSSTPIYFGALRNSLSYKDFNISVNILYKFDYYFRRSSLSYSKLFYGNDGHSEFSERWQKPGDESHTEVPSMIYPSDPSRDSFYNSSAATIEKGDHVRLQDVTADYTFKKVKGLRNCKIYANISNLGIIWRANKKGIDPDLNVGYPAPRTLAFGLSTNF